MKQPRKSRRVPSVDPDLDAALSRLTPIQLRALHRIAKDPRKGVRPFFLDARAMIALREKALSAASAL